MARIARSRCLLCGEPVHDVQMWCRHIKQRHAPQPEKAQNLAESAALNQACIQRPCLWCAVHFQKSPREHRKKCLPLLQLCLYHDVGAHGDHTGATDGGSARRWQQAQPLLRSLSRTDSDSRMRSRTSFARAPERAEAEWRRRPKGVEKWKRRKNFGWIRTRQDHANPDPLGHTTRATTHHPRGGPKLRVLHGDEQSRHHRAPHCHSGQRDVASEIRGRDSPNLVAGHTVGGHLDGKAGLLGEDREGHTGAPGGGDSRLGNADSAPVDLQRVESGAKEVKEGVAIQPRQPTARRRKKGGGAADQEHGQRRHSTQIPKSEAAEAGPSNGSGSDDPNPDDPSTCSRGISRSGPAREQLCGQVDWASPPQGESEQVSPGQGAGETATVISTSGFRIDLRPLRCRIRRVSGLRDPNRGKLPRLIPSIAFLCLW